VGYLPPSHVLYDDERLCAHDDNYDDGTDENGGTVDYWQNGEFFDSYSALVSVPFLRCAEKRSRVDSSPPFGR